MAQEERTVETVMTKDVLTADLSVSVRDCAKGMAKKGVGCTVITHDGTAVGIVTERDLVSKVLAESVDALKVPVSDIMSTPIITIVPDSPLAKAAELMARYRVRRLVVVDGRGALVGLVTANDLARTLAESKGYQDSGLNAIARHAENGSSSGPYQ